MKDGESMIIGLISDTHIKKNTASFMAQLKEFFHEVDCIIHTGDYINPQLLYQLREYKEFIGVWGNVDNQEIQSKLKEKEVLSFEGYTIGIYHGHGEAKTTIDRAYEKFKEEKVDIIIYGHSHQPLIKTYKNVLMINPGSPTSKRRERWFSYGILKLERGHIQVEMNFFR